MRRNMIRFLSVVCAAVLVTGCHTRNDALQTAEVKGSEASEMAAPKDISGMERTEEPAEDQEEPEEEAIVEYQVLDVMDKVKTESDIDVSREDIQRTLVASDIPPADTVKYVDSDKQEIMKIHYTESVVNEDDPSTYQIIQEEQPAEEIPTEYVDRLGNVKYAYVDGVWYEYRYTNSEITLDQKNEALVLTILNMDDEFDGYEVVDIDCTEVPDGNLKKIYKYRVLGRKSSVMKQAPDNVENLTVTASRQETVTDVVITEKKVPVQIRHETGTGEYIFHGWQTIDGNTYYFDKDGNKITGLHTIQGIRYMFDENGVCTSRFGITVSSQNGNIDWERVRNARVDFAYIRCGYRGYTEGELILDSRLEKNLANARQAGIETGIYLFSQAVSEQEAVEEASLAVTLAKMYQINGPIVLEVAYATPEYSGRADGLSAADRTSYVNAFCRTVQNAGYTPMICAEKGWMGSCLDMTDLKDFPLWLAQYNTNVTYTGPYEIWQYTAKGRIDGISGNVSLSIIYGK